MMTLRILTGLWLLLLSNFVAADEIELNPGHPETYTVVKGDTLWEIAARFLQNPWQWPEIWHDNPQIRNPHWIYPGDLIALSYVDGKPRLQVERPSEVRLSPQIRVSPIEQAIPVIPMNAIRPFLTHPKVVNTGELDQAPYVVDFAGEHVVGGAGDRIYVRAIDDDKTAGYMIFRPGQAYRDAETGEILGYEALYVADAELQNTGDPATLLLTATDRETLIGDRLLPIEQEKVQVRYEPHAPAKPIQGHIISVVDGVTQIGQYQVVVIDRGVADGIETGHVLEIYQSGRTQRDVVSRRSGEAVNLPHEKAGLLMVFRPFERVSFALVMKSTRAVHLLDAVQTP
ncbi:MAG TPA: LysM peptidoglycan-binding domain-containing protein [Methylococcaceae bacterium]|nr:LysM peptidoglycan-binding domain-containing protein [Methylococcaceae bacterium]